MSKTNGDEFLSAISTDEQSTDGQASPAKGGGLKPKAVTAVFEPEAQKLTAVGDSSTNTIEFSRDAAGNLLVNGGAVRIIGGSPTVANTSLIEAQGEGGNDIITLNESNGALPSANLYGGAGNDVLTGGSGADQLFGGADNDTLIGNSGNDLLFGGSGQDVLIAGDGNDQLFGEAGNDRMIWNPGDDSDLMEGGDGIDTAEVNGGNGGEQFTVTANGDRVRLDRVDPAPFFLDIGTTENLVVSMDGGDDFFSATGNLAALISITVDGGAGNDTILGSNGKDLLLGGDGNDFIDGQQGDDVALLGDGNDTFQWDPGDGNDVVEGQTGYDTLQFNGSNANEIYDLSANGERVRFTRNVGNVVMDLNDVERIDVNALGGADTIVLNDLSGTDLTQVNVNLAAAVGGGDAQPDTIVINGTDGDDVITLSIVNGALVVDGLSSQVVVQGFESSLDRIVINGLGGNDIVDATALGVGAPQLTIDGGGGDDILIGGAGADVILGGAGDDLLLGGAGVDILDGGTGSNVVIQATSTVGSNAILSLSGNDSADNLTVGRNAAGQLTVNGVVQGSATVGNTSLVRIFGKDGNDTLSLNETNGALPQAELFGGAGNDVLTGGSGADQLFGGADNDTLLGKGGTDLLFGGSGDDVLTGGDADDFMFGEGGNDRMIWNPGDDTDLMEGGAGIDTAEVNAGNGAEQFTVTANGTRVRLDRLDPAPFSLDIGTTENLVVSMNGGDDHFSATGNLAALIQITVDGGAGNDTILGSNGIDLLLGGDGDDFIDGQQGNDVIFLGAGNDTFQWDPGDGSDVVEGQDGNDTLLFNGSAFNEIFEISANGERTRLTRNIGNIVMDLNDVERIDLNALGSTDTIIVNDLTGTDVSEVNVNLAGTLGGASGDAQADTVIANGSNGNDTIDVFGSGSSVAVVGLPALVTMANVEGANDSLVINGGVGNDDITATTLAAGIVKLTLDGGAGNDTILGSQGADVILGGDGDDFVFGDNGNDVAFLGAGDDTFQWDPGDGSDLIEGQAGTDTLRFFGSGASENINILANGGRVLFLRDVGAVTMDLGDVEHIDFRALGGADNIVIGDLSGTDVTQVNLDLRGPNGGGDGSTDNIAVNATQGDDVVSVWGDAGGVSVLGLQATVNLFYHDGADRLTINGLGGNDVIDASGLEADGIKLTLNGGLGADVLIGGEGGDLFNGGDGDDLALMGAGDDLSVWNPGDDNDTLEGQAGNDTLLFNGANVAENITISANGGRVLFFRDIAGVAMDLNDVERIDVNALGGADTIVLNDLSGTDLTQVNVNLAAAVGGGDAQQDVVGVTGTAGNDQIAVAGNSAGVSVSGLPAQVNVAYGETGDWLFIDAGAGNDSIDATGLAATAMRLWAEGGAGNDVIFGGDGDDVLLGGDGDDYLYGGPGNDYLDGGAGNDTLLGGPGDDWLYNGEIVIQNFEAGAGSEDTIDLRAASGLSFDWLMAHATTVDGNAVLDLGTGGQITLLGVTAESLHTDDFLFA